MTLKFLEIEPLGNHINICSDCCISDFFILKFRILPWFYFTQVRRHEPVLEREPCRPTNLHTDPRETGDDDDAGQPVRGSELFRRVWRRVRLLSEQ